MEKYLLNKMTWPEAEQRIQEAKIVIVPVGSFEQHGHHLPLETDYTLTYSRAKKIAALTDTLVAPVIRLGYSDHHLGFPGTISLSNETLVQVLFEVVESLEFSGVKKIIFLSGHGGNDTALAMAAEKVKNLLEVEVAVFGVSDIAAFSPPEFGGKYDVHAGVQETAAMYIYDNEAVREEKIEKPEITPGFDLDLVENKWGVGTGKKLFYTRMKSVKDVSSNGCISLLDPGNSREFIPQREEIEEKFMKKVVDFIQAWKEH